MLRAVLELHMSCSQARSSYIGIGRGVSRREGELKDITEVGRLRYRCGDDSTNYRELN